MKGGINMLTKKQLKMLSPKEERILRMKNGIGNNTKHSLEEIGLQYSEHKNAIKKLVDQAMKKIK
tara:strand:- start:344 stop:538 length:195 start_codon:yes stop_codon:yes gene_type:complete